MTVNEAKEILLEANLRSIERVALQVLLSELDSKDLPNEIWRDVVGYEGYYKVSNFGRVKSFHRRKVKILNVEVDINGYLRYGLYKNGKTKHAFVHVLVAEAFIPNPENKPCVNHIDGNKQNNSIENLEWCTQSENARHAFAMGLRKSGYEHFRAKFTPEQVREIRRDCVPGDSELGFKPFAKKFNVTPKIISDAYYCKSYQNVD